jgi:hypothetical protein
MPLSELLFSDVERQQHYNVGEAQCDVPCSLRALEEALIGNFIYMANKPLIYVTNHTTQKNKIETNKIN